MIFSNIIWIFEFDNPVKNYSNFYNSMWFTFITMVTVGYGDYYPISTYGWVFSFILGVWGVMNIYLITIILSDKIILNMDES